VRREENVSFRLRVGYRMEQFKQKTSSSLLDDWVKKQSIEGERTIKSSLKASSMTLIYEVQH